MKFEKIIPFLFVFSMAVNAQTSTENYIKTTEYLSEDGESGDKKITVQYFDGLGRAKQLKQIGASPNPSGAPGDLVTHFEYDGFGRQVKDHLPVPLASSTQEITPDILSEYNGFYSAAHMTGYYYSEKTIENSPLNRVMSQAAPGNHWAKDSGHEIEFEYKTNGLNEVRRFRVSLSGNNDPTLIPDGHYEVNQLYKTTTIDENGQPLHEFKDKQGRVVLKRTTVTTFTSAGRSTDPEIVGVVQSVDTYYVYDKYGNLTYVIPPLASSKINPNDVLDALCYQYKYDDRNRLVEKKLPGKGWEYMVYDKQDRLVATQDSILKSQEKWLFTKYDKFSRVVYTGIYSSGASRTSLQGTVNGLGNNSEDRMTSSQFTLNGQQVHYTRNKAFPVNNDGSELLTVNYYDYWGNINKNGAPAPTITSVLKGLPVATSVRIIGTPTWEHSYTYYDEKARPFKAYKKNHLGGSTVTESLLDFRGKTMETETIHKRSATVIEVKTKDYFTYDNMERLTLHQQSLGNSTVRNLIAQNQYNRLGQLVTKKVGGTQLNAADRWQEINYKYNIRGWLTDINNVGLVIMGKDVEPPALNDDLFAFKIQYSELVNGGNQIAEPLYNGNISQTFWKTAEDNLQRGYHYSYDQLNRLRSADFYKQGNANITAYGEYISYDVNGNITHLVRNTGDANDNEIAMDDLNYTYAGGTSNLLLRVDDSVTTGSQEGFIDGNSNPFQDDYEYDGNGNMTTDRNKGITAITYNHLNLPTQIEFEGTTNKINYLYNAIGQKLKKTVTYSDSIKIVDYLDGFQYAGGVLQFFPHSEGYVKATPLGFGGNITSYAYNYVFNYTDHLGNVRLSYSKDPATNKLKILEENHYYPFGLKHQVYATKKMDILRGIDPSDPPVKIDYVTKTEYQYRYNGFEYQDEFGLNWYDYEWRNYDPALGRWFNIDPLAEMSRKTSPYAYALNNPVFFIDPDGMLAEAFDIDDDYKLNQDGSIELIQRTDATTDTLYATDASGNVDQNNSITVSKGVLDNTETVQIEDRISDPDNNIPTRIMDATATENSQELFEFMSDNTTNVEHSIANYENGKTFIGTSFRENAELSLTHTMNAGNGNLISHDHSHPSGTGPSSDDMSIAGRIEDLQPGTTPTFRIYNPTTGGYSTYDRSNGGTELNEAVIIFQKK